MYTNETKDPTVSGRRRAALRPERVLGTCEWVVIVLMNVTVTKSWDIMRSCMRCRQFFYPCIALCVGGIFGKFDGPLFHL